MNKLKKKKIKPIVLEAIWLLALGTATYFFSQYVLVPWLGGLFPSIF